MIGKERIKKEYKTEEELISDSYKNGIQPTTQTQKRRSNLSDSVRAHVDSRRVDDPDWKRITEAYPGDQDTDASYRQWMSESEKPTAEEIVDAIETWRETE